MRSIMESNLNYWDEVIVINKFVSDVIQLYPLNLSCSEEFQGISFFYNYEIQKLTKVFT